MWHLSEIKVSFFLLAGCNIFSPVGLFHSWEHLWIWTTISCREWRGYTTPFHPLPHTVLKKSYKKVCTYLFQIEKWFIVETLVILNGALISSYLSFYIVSEMIISLVWSKKKKGLKKKKKKKVGWTLTQSLDVVGASAGQGQLCVSECVCSPDPWLTAPQTGAEASFCLPDTLDGGGVEAARVSPSVCSPTWVCWEPTSSSLRADSRHWLHTCCLSCAIFCQSSAMNDPSLNRTGINAAQLVYEATHWGKKIKQKEKLSPAAFLCVKHMNSETANGFLVYTQI